MLVCQLCVCVRLLVSNGEGLPPDKLLFVLFAVGCGTRGGRSIGIFDMVQTAVAVMTVAKL